MKKINEYDYTLYNDNIPNNYNGSRGKRREMNLYEDYMGLDKKFGKKLTTQEVFNSITFNIIGEVNGLHKMSLQSTLLNEKLDDYYSSTLNPKYNCDYIVHVITANLERNGYNLEEVDNKKLTEILIEKFF